MTRYPFPVRNSATLSPCHLVTLPPCHTSQRVISGRKVRCVPTEVVLVGLGVILGVGVERFVALGVAVVATGVAVAWTGVAVGEVSGVAVAVGVPSVTANAATTFNSDPTFCGLLSSRLVPVSINCRSAAAEVIVASLSLSSAATPLTKPVAMEVPLQLA